MKSLSDETNRQEPGGLRITVTMQGFLFLRELVEKLSWRSSDKNYLPTRLDKHTLVIETSSIEAYITGYFQLYNSKDNVKMSFTSSFFFTCTKEAESTNRLTWAHSLS